MVRWCKGSGSAFIREAWSLAAELLIGWVVCWISFFEDIGPSRVVCPERELTFSGLWGACEGKGRGKGSLVWSSVLGWVR